MNDEIVSCPVELVATILGKKWIPTLIFILEEGPMRLGEIQRKIDGCSKKILIQQLNMLMDSKIVENRKVVKNNSIESYYSLTSYGIKLIPILNQIKLMGCRK
ncbi:MAG: helix-turn-helix domain-containing protein [Cetobacterium sp.]|uniref:winged helix-turn-helix transcriptional regulator n=1 Tax=unclassified Cetobacterium TaxID=2630983 RepID=UPI00163D2819|nr:helix-turn-helix domain-containing protein [Cetobacterium sp. 2A]MBC2856061.1 helix-turn-helix transcriptional regulator [Cetobacterium sp. 2A]